MSHQISAPYYTSDMSELYCDNDHLENDYPFRWIRPARCYTLLDDEAAIKAELDQYVKPGFGTNISAISFQPSPDPFPNEDRHDIQLFELPRHPASLTATLITLLDGHAGWETSTYAISKLPNMCREAILDLPTSAWKGDHSSSDAIAEALSSALIGLEDQMRRDFVDLFPTDLDTLKDMDQGEINKIINEDPEAHAKVLRYGQGSTALVVLRVGADVWTANIGDCEAVLGVRDSGGKSWDAKMLVDGLHNAKSNEDEKRRVEEAHPGEPDAISGEDNRLLGMIAVTRALGDGMFKLPSVYTDKVWTRLDPPMRTAAKLARLSALNVTPPYMTAVPDTLHHRIPNTAEAFLIVTSDGLTNPEYPPDDSPHTEERMWVENLGKLLDNPTRDRSNLARDLLRSTWGFGEVGRHRASAFLTLDHKEDHYQDDATVVVVILNST